MPASSLTRRALINAGVGVAAATVVGCAPVAIANRPILPAMPENAYSKTALAKDFVVVGVVRSSATAADAAGFIDQAENNAASTDLLFFPGLVAQFDAREILSLAKSAQANSVWLAFRVRRGERLANVLIDSTGEILEISQSAGGLTIVPTPLGDMAFTYSTQAAGSELRGAEIVLQTEAQHGGGHSGAYTISSNAIYGPQGDILDAAYDESQPLISVRIPIAGFRKMRIS